MVQGKLLTTIEGSEKENKPMIIPKADIVTNIDYVDRIETIGKEDKVLNILGLSIPQLYVLNSLNITKSSSSTSSLNKEFIHEPLQLFSLDSLNITKSSSASSLNKKLNGEPLQLFSLDSLNIPRSNSASTLNKKLNGEPLQLFSLDSLNIPRSSSASTLNKKFIREPTQLFSLGDLSALEELIDKLEKEAATPPASMAVPVAAVAAANDKAASTDVAAAPADTRVKELEVALAEMERALATKETEKAAARARREQGRDAGVDDNKAARQLAEQLGRNTAELEEHFKVKADVQHGKLKARLAARGRSASRSSPPSPPSPSPPGGVSPADDGMPPSSVLEHLDAETPAADAADWKAPHRAVLDADKKRAIAVIIAEDLRKAQKTNMFSIPKGQQQDFKNKMNNTLRKTFNRKAITESTGKVNVEISYFIEWLKPILLGKTAYPPFNARGAQSSFLQAVDGGQAQRKLGGKPSEKEVAEAVKGLAENIASSIDIPEGDNCEGSGKISAIEMYNFIKGNWSTDGDYISVLTRSIADQSIPKTYKNGLIEAGKKILENECRSDTGKLRKAIDAVARIAGKPGPARGAQQPATRRSREQPDMAALNTKREQDWNSSALIYPSDQSLSKPLPPPKQFKPSYGRRIEASGYTTAPVGAEFAAAQRRRAKAEAHSLRAEQRGRSESPRARRAANAGAGETADELRNTYPPRSDARRRTRAGGLDQRKAPIGLKIPTIADDTETNNIKYGRK